MKTPESASLRRSALAQVLGPSRTVSCPAKNLAGYCSPPGRGDLLVIFDCWSDLYGQLAELLARHKVNDHAASVKLYAVKHR